jgi:ribosomal protein S18 acetylase RimI-like enzyme
MTLATHIVSYRTIDLSIDAELAVAHHRDACICSFGDEARFQGRKRYLKWLEGKVEEFPEGFLMAFVGERCVGQLELEVPYGLSSGYANLFYVTEPFRGMGFGRTLHERAVVYFKSWEANQIELHCSPTNVRALNFYRSLGYRKTGQDADQTLWEMSKTI